VEQAFEGQLPVPARHRHMKLTETIVIARSALAQEEADEFSGDFQDPINIHIENDRDGCAC
jgi:hypothetical protein